MSRFVGKPSFQKDQEIDLTSFLLIGFLNYTLYMDENGNICNLEFSGVTFDYMIYICIQENIIYE